MQNQHDADDDAVAAAVPPNDEEGIDLDIERDEIDFLYLKTNVLDVHANGQRGCCCPVVTAIAAAQPASKSLQPKY